MRGSSFLHCYLLFQFLLCLPFKLHASNVDLSADVFTAVINKDFSLAASYLQGSNDIDLSEKFPYGQDLNEIPLYQLPIFYYPNESSNSFLDLIKAMRLNGVDFNEVSDELGHNLLHKAALKGDLAVVDYLLQYCEINEVNQISHNERYSPLGMAIFLKKNLNYKEELRVIESLLIAGADANFDSKQLDQSLLQYAAEKHWHEVVQLLIKYGAKQDYGCLGMTRTFSDSYKNRQVTPCKFSFVWCNSFYTCFQCHAIDFKKTKTILMYESLSDDIAKDYCRFGFCLDYKSCREQIDSGRLLIQDAYIIRTSNGINCLLRPGKPVKKEIHRFIEAEICLENFL